MFFQSRFLDIVFLIVLRFVSKMVDLGTTFKIEWIQNVNPNRPSGAKNRKCLGNLSVFYGNLQRNAAQDTPEASQGLIYHDLHVEGFSIFWYRFLY